MLMPHMPRGGLPQAWHYARTWGEYLARRRNWRHRYVDCADFPTSSLLGKRGERKEDKVSTRQEGKSVVLPSVCVRA